MADHFVISAKRTSLIVDGILLILHIVNAGGHTCLPEPVISYAENFKKHILSMPEDSWDRIESMSCYQEWGEFMSGE